MRSERRGLVVVRDDDHPSKDPELLVVDTFMQLVVVEEGEILLAIRRLSAAGRQN
jgi:hypothetical protein